MTNLELHNVNREKLLIGLKQERDEAIRKAEKAAHEYARECEVGAERCKAFDVYENIRNAGRVY